MGQQTSRGAAHPLQVVDSDIAVVQVCPYACSWLGPALWDNRADAQGLAHKQNAPPCSLGIAAHRLGTMQAQLRSEEERATRLETEVTQLRDQLYRSHRKTSRASTDAVQPSTMSRTFRSRAQVQTPKQLLIQQLSPHRGSRLASICQSLLLLSARIVCRSPATHDSAEMLDKWMDSLS